MGIRLTPLLDTSVLLFWIGEPTRLTQPARDRIRSADRCLISSISCWEIGWKMRNDKLALPISFQDFVARVRGTAELEVLPVDLQVWVANVNLDWDHRDPADRTIVATAQIRDAPIITSDTRIQRFYPLTIW